MKMNKLKNLVLGMAALSTNPLKTYDQNTVCNVIFLSYLTGCVDVFKDRKHSDGEIVKIVAQCLAKSKNFTLAIEDCKEAKFE